MTISSCIHSVGAEATIDRSTAGTLVENPTPDITLVGEGITGSFHKEAILWRHESRKADLRLGFWSHRIDRAGGCPHQLYQLQRGIARGWW